MKQRGTRAGKTLILPIAWRYRFHDDWSCFMTITTISGREFNRDADAAKSATRNGPVFITEDDRPSYVLLSIEEYRRIMGARENIADLLALPDAGVDFDPPRLDSELYRPADFT
jgi:PHD/YefM family antitoxin component YafN of YafNO toxin-antitoxin module